MIVEECQNVQINAIFVIYIKNYFRNTFSKTNFMWNMYGATVEHDEFADILFLLSLE